MSYFSTDVIAKEQLHGVVGSAVTIPLIIVEPVGTLKKKKPKPKLKWLQPVRDYLQWKVSA